ncbi:nicotinamide riboside transporter PnuC [Pseudidiomarina woesei]|uniref:Nicotinamide riboside transporter PnuC n=1 Tax=Pseudidiomarina woesei TaxID=1381080 RepID=A0A0K6H413_9GAMM|nr:nicotinamide riboside transporter PnuC [Pseudidiomarina woesei]CUA85625.1 nicotinamide mononucleotide transporter PnuC [Pseudidiomarina woesei]
MELTAIVLALLYLLLAARQSLWCWLAGAISCAIYTYLMLGAQLYMEAALQAFYVVLAGYGWWQWRYGAATGDATEQEGYSWRWHAVAIAILSLVAALCALLLQRYTAADQVWLDSFTTIFSLFATWLLTRKLYSNWLYWLVIDSVYIYLYAIKGFEKTSGLFAVYIVLILYAMWSWRRSQQEVCNNTG